MNLTTERLLEGYLKRQPELVESLAHKLFVRWMTGSDNNCPVMPLTDENMVEDEKGAFYKIETGGYTSNPGTRRDIVSDKKYKQMPYATWLMTFCRKIAKEALCPEV